MSRESRFQIGGSVSAETSIYIERSSDQELLNKLIDGELCYVFNSRQMGKSSLLLSTKSRLMDQGYVCCFVDLSRIGSSNITAEQWYAGVISELWRGLNITFADDSNANSMQSLLTWWKAQGDVPSAQKLSLFFELLVLPQYPDQRIVIFLDEVDSLLSLPFSGVDFLAQLRACVNQRAHNHDYNRLTFALFGVAIPSDMINDGKLSPFNVGSPIELRGFTLAEAKAFGQGFSVPGCDPEKLIESILAWTNGQPFLTQKLCSLVSKQQLLADEDELSLVDRTVMEEVISDWEVKDHPEHLKTIRDRVLLDHEHSLRYLVTYQQILDADQHSLALEVLGDISRLKLTGLVDHLQGQVSPRCKLYRTIFNAQWVSSALNRIRPYAEQITHWLENPADVDHWLLTGESFSKAHQWASQHQLPNSDYQFLTACQHENQRRVERWNSKLSDEIQQRKKIEADLQSALAELEEAKQQAEQASQFKSEFLARVSHDIRAPLNNILGLNYLAQHQVSDQNIKDYLNKMSDSADYILSTVNDLVDLNRVEKGELSLHSSSWYVDQILEKSIDILRMRLVDQRINLVLSSRESDHPVLIGDKDRLIQLLVNVVSHLIRNQKEGCLYIDLNTQSDEGVCDFDLNVRYENSAGVERLQQSTSLSLATALAELVGANLMHTERDGSLSYRIRLQLPMEVEAVFKPKSSLIDNKLVCIGEPADMSFLELLMSFGLSRDRILKTSADIQQHASLISEASHLFVDHSQLSQTLILELKQLNESAHIIPVIPLLNTPYHWLQHMKVEPSIQLPVTRSQVNDRLKTKKETVISEAASDVAGFSVWAEILVVDDDPINQQIMNELLSSWGMSVTLASNGREAIHHITKARFDVVLLDIEMPVLNGFETVAELKTLAKQAEYSYLSELTIVAMTAHALSQDGKTCIEMGMNDYLAKPIDPVQLQQTLSDWLAVSIKPSSSLETAENIPVMTIEGIDTISGLARCANNSTVYMELLQQFASRYGEGFKLLDTDQQQILQLHGLKGTALNLGMITIGNQARVLEKKLHDGYGLTNIESAELSQALRDVSERIISLGLQSSLAEKSCSQTTLAERLNACLAALDEDHVYADKLVSQIAELDIGHGHQLKLLMSEFDIEGAKALISNWLTELGTE